MNCSLLLVGQVAGGTLTNNKKFTFGHLIDAIISIWLNETVGLTVHGLRTQCSREQEHLLVGKSLKAIREIQKLNLNASVLLRAYTFSFGPIVVSARLSVELAKNGVALAELNLAIFLQMMELPADKRVVVRVAGGRNE